MPLSNGTSTSSQRCESPLEPLLAAYLVELTHSRCLVSSRKTFDMYVTGKKSFNYGAILELDKEYRKILDSMPDTWIHEHKNLEDQDPFLRSRRFGALQSGRSETSLLLSRGSQADFVSFEIVHNRIVRLHRPFLTKGYAPNSKFAYSTEACIKSAKIVLFCHHNNYGFVVKPLYSHSLSVSSSLLSSFRQASR